MGLSTTLRPVIGVSRLLGLTFAAIAPCASVFLTYGAAYQSAGTGLVLGFIIGAILNLVVMFDYAEVGKLGYNSLASRALGPRVGSIYTSLFSWKGLVIPATLSIATASYVDAALPAVPITIGAVVVLFMYLGLSFSHLATSSFASTVRVVVEAAVLLGFLILAVTSFGSLSRSSGIR